MTATPSKMVRDYIEHGKQPNFHYLDQQGICLCLDYNPRRYRPAAPTQRACPASVAVSSAPVFRPSVRPQRRDARKAARLERKAASTLSSREKSRPCVPPKAARDRIAGRNRAPRVPSCLSPATAAKASRQPTRQRFADRFRGPGYKNAATTGGGLP